MMLKEHSVVALTVELAELGLRKGDIGTIVYVSETPPGYIVEFNSYDGAMIGLPSLALSDVRLLDEQDVPHARRLVAPVAPA